MKHSRKVNWRDASICDIFRDLQGALIELIEAGEGDVTVYSDLRLLIPYPYAPYLQRTNRYGCDCFELIFVNWPTTRVEIVAAGSEIEWSVNL